VIRFGLYGEEEPRFGKIRKITRDEFVIQTEDGKVERFPLSRLNTSAVASKDSIRLENVRLQLFQKAAVTLKPGQALYSAMGKARTGNIATPLGDLSVITDRGPKSPKTKSNQDSLLVGMTPEGHLAILVADGISTGGGGADASNTIVRSAWSSLSQGRSLKDAFNGFIPALQQAAQRGKNRAKMGATVLGVTIDENGGVAWHLGDVRLVQIHGNQVFETRDHNLGQEKVEEGQLTPETRLHSPYNRGVTRQVRIGDSYEETPMSPTPNLFGLDPGDLVIVASDGVWGVMTTREVTDFVQKMSPPEHPVPTAEIAAALRAEVQRRTGQGFEPDNVTIVVYRHKAEGF
jgi:serine/threonine protein phosphatase PrpC